MGENSKIEWTDHTFNPWLGCTRVSAGCLNCYAEAMTKRFKRVDWGPKAARVRTSPQNWNQVRNWNRTLRGRRARVFCASLADVFDDHPSILPAWREELWALIAECQNLDWLLLTKRPQNWPAFLPVAEPRPPFEHVRLGVSIEDEAAANDPDRVGPLVFAHSIGWPTFVSYEPALSNVRWQLLHTEKAIDWLIIGGESGPQARPFCLSWARNAIEEARQEGVPVFVKQLGAQAYDDISYEEAAPPFPTTDRKGGDMREWPGEFRVREFPGETRRPVSPP